VNNIDCYSLFLKEKLSNIISRLFPSCPCLLQLAEGRVDASARTLMQRINLANQKTRIAD
jgi:hypothetical protein